QTSSLGNAPVEQISLSAPNSQSSASYLLSDPEGVRLTFNSSGVITAYASYDAYGNVISGGLSSVTPFGYAGGYTDPTGLIYLVNRYYDPSTGQFLSVDPLVGVTDQPYQYVGGDPINNEDPNGLACLAALELGFTRASRQCWKSGYKKAGHDVAHGTVGVCISGVAGAGVGGVGQVCIVESQGFKHAGFTETLGGRSESGGRYLDRTAIQQCKVTK
ncbi:MAG: RHS repeat-associated core domain-containing protein, partial [Actinobacteria bacterium]|nr:RHS repeat-associated core domain-containing protein [Actinomycetota bacterium]